MRLELLKLIEYLVLNVVEVQGPLALWVFCDLESYHFRCELYVYLDQSHCLGAELVIAV